MLNNNTEMNRNENFLTSMWLHSQQTSFFGHLGARSILKNWQLIYFALNFWNWNK